MPDEGAGLCRKLPISGRSEVDDPAGDRAFIDELEDTPV